jgi:hypothetical protein
VDSGAVAPRYALFSIDLKSGSIIVSVRKPSDVALIHTPLGTASVHADGDVLVSYDDGVMRVSNLDGLGKNVLVQIHSESVSAAINGKPATEPLTTTPLAMAIAMGYEFISGDHKLGHAELRPADGIARRNFSFLNGGFAAVNEFSLESVLRTSGLIVDVDQALSGVKERRIVADMSKMAAVLNYMHGSEGFVITAEPAVSSSGRE